MTEYFEIHARDGLARRGELRLEPAVPTPALVDDVLEDAGSRWPEERAQPAGDATALTVLPHRGFPAGTDERVQAGFAPEYPDVEYPSAAVVTPEIAADHGADAYLLSTAQGIVGHASAFVDAIVRTREAIPEDTALGLSGVATPRNVATLVYAGVDLLDTTRAVVRGTQGRYLTVEGAYPLDDLEEFPCACPACRRPPAEFDREACVEHNVNALEAALRTVRRRIDAGRLRDYVEGQARHDQWLTAAFRELDERWAYLEPRTPVARRAEIAATTEDTLRRVEIRRFADRVTGRYAPRYAGPLVIVPCSARKPYGDSQSHGQFRDAIDYRAHKLSMTSPIGVVPQELELTYPAQHYDAAVTGRWSETEIDFVARVLRRYLERTADAYTRVIAHVPPEGYRAVCERAAGAVDLPVEYTVAEHPTTADSLAALAGTLEGEPRYSRGERHDRTVRAIADYQFGDRAGDALFEPFGVRGRHPKLRVHDAGSGDQLAAVVPEYGLLALTLAGARRWRDADVPTRTVGIDAFVPHGSVLAPGVVDADGSIRPGDEVLVEGPDAFGVGRAATHGDAMVESTRGVAVDVRHVAER